MARYDDNNRDRWRDEDRERSNWRSGSQGTSEREDERGFFERAGEEIRSWFSDEDDRDGQRDQSWDRDQNQRHGRSNSDYGDRSSFGGMSQGGYGRSGGSDRGQSGSGYGPSRGGERGSMSNRARSGFGEDRGYRNQSTNRGQSGGQRSWDRDRDQDDGSYGYRGNMSGSLGGFGNQTSFGSGQDDHYRSWRDRQLAELDRDYEDYCREREQKFHSDFDTWRQSRSSRSPSAVRNASGTDLPAAVNAGVGTTTSSVTGTGGTGSALGRGGSATGESAMTVGSTPMADATNQTGTADSGTGTGGGRSGSRSRS